MKRKILSILLAICLVAGLLPTVALAADGDVQYRYCDENGANWQTGTKTANEYTTVTSRDTEWGTSGETTWYVVTGDVTIGTEETPQRVTVSGDVHLILADGCELTVNGGIQVEDDDYDIDNGSANALTIYAQSTGSTMGKLTATIIFGSGAAAIGGGDENVEGSGACGIITINGGFVTANASNGFHDGAGIGSASTTSDGGPYGAGGTVTINGGTVTAISVCGAGIGSGTSTGTGRSGDGGIVTINGGTVTATSVYGAGIGSGSCNDGDIGDPGTFQTNGGNAVIFASSIADQSNKSNWSGIVFEGSNNGIIYGTSVTPSEDFTIPSEKTLEIGSGQILTIPESVTMTNEGTIENSGTIYVDGTFTGTLNGAGSIYYALTVSGGTADLTNPYNYNNKTYAMTGSEITLTPDTPPTGYGFGEWEVSSDSTVTVGEDNKFTMPSAALKVTAQWKDIEKPVITGLENGKTYCASVEFEASDNDGIASVKAGSEVLTAGTNGKYTLATGVGTVTVVVTDNTGNTAEMTVTVNNGHTYEWQDDNGQYWKKCKFCGDETAKKDIPTITINGADSVCITENYKFSCTLPEGVTDVSCGFEFERSGDGLPAIIENNELHGVMPVDWYASSENSFKVYVGAKTTDGFGFIVYKTVVLQSENNNDTKLPQTGDNSHITLWFVLLFVSGSLLTVTGIYGKKKKHSKI